MTSRQASFRMPKHLITELQARTDAAFGGGVSEALREALSRYFELLSQGRRSLRERPWTPDDLANLIALGATTSFGASSLTGLLDNAIDALPDEVPCPASLDSTRDRLRMLELVEHAALVDCVERFRQAVRRGFTVEPARLLEDPALSKS